MPANPLDLDIEQPLQLTAYLRQTGRIPATTTPTLQVLAGGVSNRTVLVTLEDGRSWVLKQALAKLRVKVDWFCDPVRIEREAQGLRYLEQLAPQGTITPLVFEDHQHHLLAMTAVPQPHQNWKDMLLAGQIHTDHVAQFGSLLAGIHRSAYERREELSQVFADRSFFKTLRLEPYYTYTAKQLSARASYLSRFFDELCRDTLAHAHTLVHGDYSPKNILVHQDKLILLDHEVIHWGDPAFDLGFGLAHLLSKAHHLPEYRQTLKQAVSHYWQVYQQSLGNLPFAGRDYEARVVRHTLACLLARVAGRSTLEYLTPAQRQIQQAVVIRLIAQPVLSIEALLPAFLFGIGRADD